ncbi:hypothetical protein WJ438_00110 [Streptomyces sp. GD-15H]|uniref:hypothetical protein n=1 Tax=Streptomyces sp. GD-15H TaxID=3129112 RepID=UPI0032448EBB
MSPAERLVDTAQIVSEFGTSKPRISEWSNDPDSGFPAVAHTEGRKRFWPHDEVAAFFAKRAPKKRTLPAAVLEADQDELLTKREVAKLLGYTRASTIDAYFRDRPGYFPEPDEDIDGPMWRRGTIVTWASSRPGKGRRRSAPAAPLPTVPIDGDPDELLGTAEVASLLGYSSVASFSSALYQGRIPELPEPETLERGKAAAAEPARSGAGPPSSPPPARAVCCRPPTRTRTRTWSAPPKRPGSSDTATPTASSARSGTGSCPISSSPTGSNTAAAVPADRASNVGNAPASRSWPPAGPRRPDYSAPNRVTRGIP